MKTEKMPYRSKLCVLLPVVLLFCFGSKTSAQEIQLETISISKGLASPTVFDVMQDSYGLLWIGTSNGMQRYDGYTWKNYRNIIGDSTTLLNNTVYGIEEDQDRNLWIATDLGISFFDRSRNTFKNYNFLEIFEIPGGGRALNILQDSQGRIWASTVSQDIVRYDPAKDIWERAPFANVNGEPAVHDAFSIALYEDKAGTIWSGSTVHGLMSLTKGSETFTPVKFKEDNLFNTDYNVITAFYEDEDGILWITSRQGIYKYDPKKNELRTVVTYTFNNIDIANFFNAIKADAEGNIWVLNNFRGVLKFEGNSDNYQEIIIPDNRKVTSGGWTIKFTELIMDKSGIFWFGSVGNGLFKYDPVNKPFKYYSHDPQNSNSLSAGGAFGLFASKISPGKVFVGTRGNGFNIIDESDQTIKKVSFASAADMFGGSARSMYEQSDGTFWVGTWGDGLIKMDKNYKEIKRFKRNPADKNSLVNDQVRVIREDRAGKLWVGTNGGLTILDPKSESFNELVSKYVRTYPDEILAQTKKWLENKEALAIIEKVTQNQELTQEFQITEKGTYYVVWVGEGDLASMVDYGWLQNAAGESIQRVETIDDTFWAGGEIKNRFQITQTELNPGTYALRYTSDDSHHYGSWNAPEPEFLPLYGIAIFKQDDQIASQSLVVNVNEQKTEIIIQDGNISDIEIGKKYIWVASSNAGVTRIDPETNAVQYYISDPADPATLSSPQVMDVLEDENGLLWMATYGGINVLDIATGEITKYTEQDGLSTNILETVLPGENGEMWFSSQNGLIQMMRNESLGKVTFINYNESDGLGGNTFLSLAAGKTSDGDFYFGGDHGVTTFSTIASNKIPPSVILSNLSVSNRSIYDMGAESPLQVDLLGAKEITLRYDQNDLSFEFAALHYANPSKNQYAHMLEGLDQDWIYDNRNFAAYTNLEPGVYTFKVIASNAYGVWNEEGVSLLITILPPWWKTWWAYTIYFLILAMMGFVAYSGLKKRIRMMERERSLEKEVAQAKEIEKAYQDLKATQSQLIQAEKMASLGELTAGIAHEIQNPLNFVNNFSEVSCELIDEVEEERAKSKEARDEQLISEVLADIKENLTKINHHGKRADFIVKGMLEHSRSTSSEKKETNINSLADEFLRLSFHGLRAKDKSFSADFETDLDPNLPRVKVVAQDIGRVVLNLINNAFYAVNEQSSKDLSGFDGDNKGNLEDLKLYHPKVTVRTRLVDLAGQGGVEISIEDNGAGIPKEIKDKIFQPFFTTKPTGSGTGLGLSLSYDIIKAHGGDLRVKSVEGEGTEMIIFLPIN